MMITDTFIPGRGAVFSNVGGDDRGLRVLLREGRVRGGRVTDVVVVVRLVHGPPGRKNHLEQDLPEFVVFVAVDDKVNGGVDR